MVSCPPASEQQRKVFVGRHTFIFCFHLDRVPRYFAANSATQFVLRAAVLLARALERCLPLVTSQLFACVAKMRPLTPAGTLDSQVLIGML